MRTPSGFYIDNPAWPLVQTTISYWGLTTVAGNVLGTTIECADLANEPSYVGLVVKLLDGAAAGQVRQILAYAANVLTVANPFTNAAGGLVQVLASTRFVIISTGGGGGGPPGPPAPSVGLWMFGVCDPGMGGSANTLLLTNLAGFPNDIFNNEFWVQVIHNANSVGNAPEREIRRVLDYAGATGTFITDPFTAPVEANDLCAVFHESIMAIEILGFGTLDTDSATVPADNARAEGNDYFNGCLLMPTEGVCRFQPRRIIDYDGPAGIFYLDPNYPLTAAPGLVDYVIIGDQCGYSWPYIQALMSVNENPQVGQPSIEVARLEIHNLRPDGTVIPDTEYAGATISIDRYRHGVDAGWVNQVAGTPMLENAGYANYSYNFPPANWQDGDLIRYNAYSCVVTMPAGAIGGSFYVPPQAKFGVIGGLTALGTQLDLIFALVNAELTLQETGATFTATGLGTEDDIYRVEIPMGVFHPVVVKLDTTAMVLGDSITVRVYERIRSGIAMRLSDTMVFAGLQAIPLKTIHLDPNRFGVRVSLEQTLAAGAWTSFDWSAAFEA